MANLSEETGIKKAGIIGVVRNWSQCRSTGPQRYATAFHEGLDRYRRGTTVRNKVMHATESSKRVAQPRPRAVKSLRVRFESSAILESRRNDAAVQTLSCFSTGEQCET